MPERHINTFEKGIKKDFDNLLQPSGSYKSAKNIRILFNEDGTYAIENIKGNKVSFALPPFNANHQIIGSAEFDDKVVVFTTDGVDSSVGVVTVDKDGIGTYTSIYDDSSSSIKLNFSTFKQIEAVGVRENSAIENVYWTDDNNEPRVINILQNTGTFPYNPNSFQLNPDINTGFLKFIETVDGGLMVGAYQYTYRLRNSNGYATPYMPLTNKLFVTSDDVNSSNWTTYEMEASQSTSNKGIKLKLTAVDTRYDYVDFAYVYSISDTSTLEAGIFTTKPATLATIEVTHSSNAADPVVLSEIPQTYAPIEKAKTLAIKDNIMFMGNIEYCSLDFQADLTNLSVAAVLRDYESDQEGQNTLLPLTNNGTTAATTFTLTRYTGQTESYDVKNDWENYKGVQYDMTLKGYFRGETYRFGIVFYDLKGNPSLVQHLCDVDFPEQYNKALGANGKLKFRRLVNGSVVETDVSYNGTDFTLTDGSVDGSQPTKSGAANNQPNIRIMGVSFSGIDISSIKDNISGFSIVRAERDKQIVAQGAFLPTVSDSGSNDIYPLPWMTNKFDASENYQAGTTYVYEDHSVKYFRRSALGTFFAPEYMFGSYSFPEPTNNHKVIPVTGCYAYQLATYLGGREDHKIGLDADPNPGNYNHYYSKNYFTDSLFVGSGVTMGQEEEVNLLASVGAGSDLVINDALGGTFHNKVHINGDSMYDSVNLLSVTHSNEIF